MWTGMPRQAENAAIVRAGNLVFSLEDDAELVVGRVSGARLSGAEALHRRGRGDMGAAGHLGKPDLREGRPSLALWTTN